MSFRLVWFLFLGCAAGDCAPTPTFNRDVAPIVFANCTTCHHPDGAAPFSLTTYRDVKKRAKLIKKVTQSRYMPPWLAEHGYGEFKGERRLTDVQIETFAAWVAGGTPEGAASDLTAKATWSSEWQLGKPDVEVTLAEGYVLPAAGRDVYRNFVLPEAIPNNAYLRAVEFHPNSAAIHHAFVLFDAKHRSRSLDGKDGKPGFTDMTSGGASSTSAMFASWQPGRKAVVAPEGLAAPLAKGTDVVLQLHMRPTGKREPIQPTVGLYFSKDPPTRTAVVMCLRSVTMDIPAGKNDYTISASYKLPTDVEVLSVLPHMHYLGKEIRGWADLPDGTQKDLILIKRWDFNWQTDYRYVSPVGLPKGSTLHMSALYDNSADNPVNPNQPPKRVRFGLQSSDEMGELWIQLIPSEKADYKTLMEDVGKNAALPDALALGKAMIRIDPTAENYTKYATVLAVAKRLHEALSQLDEAVAADAQYAPAYCLRGRIYMQLEDAPSAKAALEQAVLLQPDDPRAQCDLGWVLLAMGKVRESLIHLEKSVELDPSDRQAQKNLEKARSVARDLGL